MATNTKATKAFADILSDLIKATGKTIKEISKECGVAAGSLSKYQNDEGEAGINNLLKIADYFGVNADYLLGRTECPSANTDVIAINKKLGLSLGVISELEEIRSHAPHLISILNELLSRWHLWQVPLTIYRYRELSKAIKNIDSLTNADTQHVSPIITVELRGHKLTETKGPAGVVRADTIDAHSEQHTINSTLGSALNIKNLEDLSRLALSAAQNMCSEWILGVISKEASTNADET